MSNPTHMSPLPLATSSHQAYVSELLSFTLDRLHKEPDLLRVDAERIKRQMQEVAVGHYRGFISAADALQSIRLEIGAVDHHLMDLISEVPKLAKGCNDFMGDALQLLEDHRHNRTLSVNHGTLLDLLEIPQLMDTCVRNGNYDEALDLEALVTKLVTVHPRLPVIQSLAEEVRQTTQSLLAQILQRLRSNIQSMHDLQASFRSIESILKCLARIWIRQISSNFSFLQLPECLRLIGYLRRLALYTEEEMCLQFLKCRESWLVGIIDDLDRTNPYEYLKRIAECHKVHLFDVVTQYRAIFVDDTSFRKGNGDAGFLYSWATHRIISFLTLLRDLLPKITEGVSLGIILEQSMYCGMSLGRVGLDFRGLLPPLFERCVYKLFIFNMSITVENFQHVLDSHRWAPLPPMGTRYRGDTGFDDISPPYSLMDHQPLAAFVNGVLAALNELRHCAPTNLKLALAFEIKLALQNMVDSLLRYNATRMLREVESTLFLAMCRAFLEVGCPYVSLCFGRCYSGGANLIQLNDVLEGLRRLVGVNVSTVLKDGLEKHVDAKNSSIKPKKHSPSPSVENTGVVYPGTAALENGRSNQNGIFLHGSTSVPPGNQQGNIW